MLEKGESKMAVDRAEEGRKRAKKLREAQQKEFAEKKAAKAKKEH